MINPASFFTDDIYTKIFTYATESHGALVLASKQFSKIIANIYQKRWHKLGNYYQGLNPIRMTEQIISKESLQLKPKAYLDLSTILRNLGDIGEQELSYLLIRICQFTNSYALAKLLIKKGANLTAFNKKGLTALHYAALTNQKNTCQLLITNGADVNSRTRAGATPLHLAAIACKAKGYVLETFSYLSSLSTCNFELEDIQRMKPLDYLPSQLFILPDEILKMILSNKVLQNDLQTQGRLSQVCRRFRAINEEIKNELEEEILQYFYLKTITEIIHQFPQDENQQLQNRDLLITFIKKLKIKEVNIYRLIIANFAHYPILLPAIKLLVQKGASLSLRFGADETTLLHQAVMVGNKPLAKWLIEVGIDVNAKQKDGQTPLHLISSFPDKELCELLLEKGAVVEARDNKLRTPLHYVAIAKSSEIWDLLIQKGADEQSLDARGYSPRRLLELQNL